MWRNKESQSTAPGASSGRIVEPSSGLKVPANSGIRIRATAQTGSWLTSTMKVKGEVSGNEDLLVDGKVEGPVSVGNNKLTVGAAVKLPVDLRHAKSLSTAKLTAIAA